MELRCSRCDKKLSRTTARMIDGKVLCSPCVFPPMKAERQMVARARHAFTRLVGMEAGDKLADELWESRISTSSRGD